MPSQEPKGCLTILFQLLGLSSTVSNDASPTALPYDKKKYFFSQAERKFYQVLLQTVDQNKYTIFAKVRLADIVQVAKRTEKWQSHFNRISSKHVDFLVCPTNYFEPMLIIELDDSSHDKEDRQERDGFLDQVCQAAGIPILHIKPKVEYNHTALTNLIKQHL